MLRMNKTRLLGHILVASMLSVTSASAGSPDDVEAVLAWMSGEFNSAHQVAEDSTARLRHVYGTRVHIPNVPGETVYIEWHAGGPDGPIDSQRIWAYEAKGDHIAMRFYTFFEKADAALTGIRSPADVDAEAVAGLTLNDFTIYPDECTFVLYRTGDVIEGKSGTGACRIFNRSLDVWMRPDVTLTFEPDGFNETAVYSYEPKSGGAEGPEQQSVIQDFRRLN